MARYNSVGFWKSGMRSTFILKLLLGVILFEESFALIRILKKWPLGGQNADFMLFKLNNRLVNRRLSRNSAFLLYF